MPKGLKLDARRGSVVTVGDRRWTLLLSSEAAQEWRTLGSREIVVGALVYEHSGTAAPFVHRELVLVPRRRKLELQVRDPDKGVLWTGPAFVNRGGDLEFSIPITRSTSSAKGMMKGRLKSNGQVSFTESKLPRPVNKSEPAEVDQG